jgi:serine/threonine-protein kinase HipA
VHLRARAREVIPLVRGGYASEGADIDQTVMAHADRIAHYTCPTPILRQRAPSCWRRPRTGVFSSGRRNQRTRSRTLETVQDQAAGYPSTAAVVIGGDLGELRLRVSSPQQRRLAAFRLQSEHATAVSADMRRQMVERLIDEHGFPIAAAHAVWMLARDNGWYRAGEGAERFLLTRPSTTKPADQQD